jgi:hypothetical protein
MRAMVDTFDEVRNFAVDPRATSWGTTIGPRFYNDRWVGFQTYSLVTGATDGPGVCRDTYARLTVTGAHTGLGFHLPDNTGGTTPAANRPSLAVQPGEVVTSTIWVRASVSCSANLQLRAASDSVTNTWVAASVASSFLMAANTWCPITVTYTVPAGASRLVFTTFITDNLSPGATVDATGLLITKTPALIDYIDGFSDGCRWAGTFNLSESVKENSVQPIRNVLQWPAFADSTGIDNRTRFSNLGPSLATVTVAYTNNDLPPEWMPPGGFVREETLTSAGNFGRRWIPHNAGEPVPIKAGDVVRARWWMKYVSSSLTTVNFQFQTEYSDDAGNYVGGDSALDAYAPGGSFSGLFLTIPTNRWVLVSFIRVAGSKPLMSTLRTIGFNPPATSYGVTGDIVKFANGMTTVNQPLPSVYSDGNTPGWKWESAAGISSSVGWPYSLQSIVGEPIVQIYGSTPAPVTTPQLGPLSGRTTYQVTKRLNVAINGLTIAFGHIVSPGNSNSTGDIRVTGDASGAFFQFRPQFTGGGGAGGVYGVTPLVGGLAPRPPAGSINVLGVNQSEGLANAGMMLNGDGYTQRTNMVVGTGYNDNGGVQGVRSFDALNVVVYEAPLYMVQFKGEHSPETMKKVSAWLARRYGGTIPAGY